MSNPLLGKRALVTGASKGIGLAIAHAFADEGANVVICARQQQSLDKALADLRKTAKGKISGYAADVSKSADVARLFGYTDQELGGLDILVNNAGIGIFHSAAEMSVEEWDQVIGINLSGAFYCTREALSRFEEARGGRIINISSLAGKNPFAGGSAYNASKFGLNALSEATMLDHRHDDVAVTYIMPGSVATQFSGEAGQRGADWKIAPEDIAEIVLGVVRLPKRTLVSRIEVRPSRPQKD
jgi:NAD(P)-dependent dehydrogenase (short-subunit alcohol dehydrogenase family)